MAPMNYLTALIRLLAALALLGMLTAPVASAAVEHTMAGMRGSAATSVDGLKGDMSCCPDEQRGQPECDNSCPLVIICSTSPPSAVLKGDWASAALPWTSYVFAGHRFDRLNSISVEPPARPPKA